MIHRCKVQCHSMNAADLELLGIGEDSGKWLPFSIDLENLNAIKMSTDESDDSTYLCSTIFCKDGNTFIVDTPYYDLVDKWEAYLASQYGVAKDENNKGETSF